MTTMILALDLGKFYSHSKSALQSESCTLGVPPRAVGLQSTGIGGMQPADQTGG